MTFQDGDREQPLPPVPPRFEGEEEEELEEEPQSGPGSNYSDPMADLFEVPDEQDWDMRVDDLVEVDVEADIVDGPLDDLTDTSSVMGDELGQQPRTLPGGPQSKQRRPLRRQPPPPGGLAGMR